MKQILRSVLLLVVLCVAGKVVCGQNAYQVATGTPQFGSYGGSVDTVNLGDLNVHLTIPILNKAGRGMPFTYGLTYDSSVWLVQVAGGSLWQPGNLGFGAAPPAGLGQLTASACGYSFNSRTETVYEWCDDYTWADSSGTSHALYGARWEEVVAPANTTYYCSNGSASDGSGYSLSWQTTTHACGASIVKSPTGTTVTEGANTTPISVVDANGNEITESSGTYTDTLGTTALTIAGSGTPSSPMTYSYTAPSGATAKYTVKYTSKTVRTNFGCSGISEYGPTTQNLVTEVDLPDVGVNASDKYTFTYEPTPGYSGDTTARLESVTLPTGGTITYYYAGNNDGITCSDGSTNVLWRYTPDSGNARWTYTHTENGTAWSTVVDDPQGNETDLDFQAISYYTGTYGPSSPTGTYWISSWNPYETQRQIYQGTAASGTLLETVNTCYNGAASPCNSTAMTLPIDRRTVYKQWPGGLTSEIDQQFNPYGQASEVDEYAYGQNGVPGGIARKTITTYDYLSNNYGFISKPSQITVEDGSNNIASQTTYCYDEAIPSGSTTCGATGAPTATSGTPQQVAITGSRGNPTTISYLVGGTSTLSKTFTYYDTGNVYLATDVNGAQTTYSYTACGNSFPTYVTEPLIPAVSASWNCTGGVGMAVSDPNGKTIEITSSDPYFWRPTSATDQLNDATLFSYTPISMESSMPFNGNNSTVDVRATVDSVGRMYVGQVRQGPTSSYYDSVSVQYNSVGERSCSTLPYVGVSGESNLSGPYKWCKTFDALGRSIQTTNSGGLVENISYVKNDVYQAAGPAPSGENQKRKQMEYDALGRLTSVCEVTAGTASAPAGTCGQTSPQTGYWTQYTYDLNNKLTGVSQNSQSSTRQARSFTYDDLGRMTSENNPESGTTTYTYDRDATCGTSKGDLVKKVDNMGNVTCYAHDALHRMTSTTYSGPYASVTPGRYFVYDSATVDSVTMTNAEGRMAEAYTCFSPCSTKITDIGFSYTARGQVSDVYESVPNAGGYYHVNETYFANRAVNTISGIVGLPTITYNVDGEGRMYSATASSGQNPLLSTTYSPAGLPLQVTFGSSDSDSFTYDQNSNRITQYKFNVNGQSVVGALNWNGLGTLASLTITDPFNSTDAQTCTYAHDDLTRVASVGCGTVWSESFSYDAFGNMNKSGTSQFEPIYSATTNQMTSIGGDVPSYDGDGNVTDDFVNMYSWDANGRPVTTTDGAASVSVTYDALGRMVEQNRSGAYTEIVYAPTGAKLALMYGATLEKGFISLPGNSAAVYTSSGLDHYRHPDWLGSVRLCSSPSRTVTCDVAYGPFGEPYAQSGADLSFTGMNQDTLQTLYDFPEREYGIQGRWPSPDPAGIASARPSDPQTWNRYAYVRNSPLNDIDALGLGGCNALANTAGCSDTDVTAVLSFDPSNPLGLDLPDFGNDDEPPPPDVQDEPLTDLAQMPGGPSIQTDVLGGGVAPPYASPDGGGPSFSGGTIDDNQYAAAVFGQVYQQTSFLTTGSFYAEWAGASVGAGAGIAGFVTGAIPAAASTVWGGISYSAAQTWGGILAGATIAIQFQTETMLNPDFWDNVNEFLGAVSKDPDLLPPAHTWGGVVGTVIDSWDDIKKGESDLYNWAFGSE